jgi:2OG-Fe(II) oxygenase superfamily
MDKASADLHPWEAGQYCLSPATLRDMGRSLRERYLGAHPFPHVVLDDLFPTEILDRVLAEFPSPQQIRWQEFDTGVERKLMTTSEEQLGPATRHFVWQLNSQPFLLFLEDLTGISGLIPDPHLGGGGLHQIVRGGLLKVHADFNRHLGLNLDRRLNLLCYLNRNWKEEYGGHLELWDREMKSCVQRILPVFNRCVIFSTTDFSYHGHPDPLTCPNGWSRKSLALYYYSNGRPDEERSGDHSTLFRMRPGEAVETRRQYGLKDLARDCTPPLVWKGLHQLRRRLGR